MKKFEYCYISMLDSLRHHTSALNKKGKEGWELVSVVKPSRDHANELLYYFKREITF